MVGQPVVVESKCSCDGPGYCTRHGIFKTGHWHLLCRTRDEYRNSWDEGRGPGQSGAANQPKPRRRPSKLERAHASWKALHCYRQVGIWDANEAARWYEDDWKPTVPSAGCSCRRHWLEIESKQPPEFLSENAFFRWGFDRHNDINRMLGKREYTWQQAIADRQNAV